MNTKFVTQIGVTALVAGLGAPAFAGPTYENASGGTFLFSVSSTLPINPLMTG